MMKTKKVIRIFLILVIAILLLLTSFIVTDRIRFSNGEAPIFARGAWGGECKEYIGIGYTVMYYYPETTIDDTREYSPDWYWFWEE